MAATASTRRVEDVVVLGRPIAEIEALLQRGEFLAWSREAVPLQERTVQRWLAVAELARREPAELERLSHGGPAKIHRIAMLRPERRRALKLRTPMPVPGVRGHVRAVTRGGHFLWPTRHGG